MTKLGHTKKEARWMYFGEFVDKYRIYKKMFNMEKTYLYKEEVELNPAKTSSLKDF